MPAPTLGRGTTLNTTPRRRKVSLKRSSRSTSRHLTIALASESSLPLTIRQTAVLPGLRATAKNRVEIDYDVERWSEMSEKDYVLGTHDEELLRLGLQHRVWRPVVLDCWQKAGITTGKRVLDLGAGPGYAALDLAEIVGRSGEVVALERSGKFVAAMRESFRRRGLTNARMYVMALLTCRRCSCKMGLLSGRPRRIFFVCVRLTTCGSGRLHSSKSIFRT